jgi:hypothetical protein
VRGFDARHERSVLRHVPPPAGSAELAAARQAALAAANRAGAPPGRLNELQRATPEQMASEVARLFSSVRGTSLLLAGALSTEAAEALVSVVRSETAPLLPPDAYLPRLDLGAAAQPVFSIEDELAQWEYLLYKPTFASSLSLSACSDPAIARALDQCGAL